MSPPGKDGMYGAALICAPIELRMGLGAPTGVDGALAAGSRPTPWAQARVALVAIHAGPAVCTWVAGTVINTWGEGADKYHETRAGELEKLIPAPSCPPALPGRSPGAHRGGLWAAPGTVPWPGAGRWRSRPRARATSLLQEGWVPPQVRSRRQVRVSEPTSRKPASQTK